MKIKHWLIVGGILFIMLQIVTNGKFLSFILPATDQLQAQLFCRIAGLLLSPMINFGAFGFPIPTIKDALLVSLPSGFFIYTILRYKQEPKWRSPRRILTVSVGIFLLMLAILKIVGFYCLMLAEDVYGQTGCAEKTQFQLTTTYALALLLLSIAVILSLAKVLIEFRKKESKAR